MKKELRFERVENPEGWKVPVGCEVGLICTNIGRDAIAWFGPGLSIEEANAWADEFIAKSQLASHFFRNREGDKVPAPTVDDVIWPRFVPVEVEGGWSVHDLWEGKRRDYVWEGQGAAAISACHWNVGDNGEPEVNYPRFKWIPYTPNLSESPDSSPEQRLAEVERSAVKR